MSKITIDQVEKLIKKGFTPIPIKRTGNHKTPCIKNWQNLRCDSPDFSPANLFRDDNLNIGILLGHASCGLVDIDLDCTEAIRVADHFLPPTEMISGRPGMPQSHRWYQVDSPPQKASEAFDDPIQKKNQDQRNGLIELRSTGSQTVIWGKHVSGEQITYSGLEPAKVDLAILQQAVKAIAAVCLLARYWVPPGQRNEAFLALCGGFVRLQWSVDRIQRFVSALCHATGDEEKPNRLRQIEPTLQKYQSGENITGWPRLEELIGPESKVVSQVQIWLGADHARSTHIHATTIDPSPSEAIRLAPEVFYGLPGEIILAMEPTTEADPAALLLQLLVRFGNCVGRGPFYHVEDTPHYCNEFCVIIGSTSGGRKGTSNDRIEPLFQNPDDAWHSKRCLSGLSSGEGVIWNVRDPIMKWEKVSQGKGQPPKQEWVLSDPGEEDKRLQIYEPEFANVLKVAEREGNNLSAILRQMWDGKETIQSLTKNSPACATKAHVSICGHITPTELKRYLKNTEIANGFANRFLLAFVKRSKHLPDGGRIDSKLLEQMKQKVWAAVLFAKNVQEMHRDEEAKELWRSVYPHLTREQTGLAGELLARGAPHVIRLSMIYALLDQSSVIRLPHLQAALAVWDYCEQSVIAIFGESTGNALADDLYHLLQVNQDGLTKAQIYEHTSRNTSAKKLDEALNLLRKSQLASCEQISQGKGRPAELWKVTQGHQLGECHVK